MPPCNPASSSSEHNTRIGPIRKKPSPQLIGGLGAFVSTASGLVAALGYFVQAKVYHKDNPIAFSYSVCRLASNPPLDNLNDQTLTLSRLLQPLLV